MNQQDANQPQAPGEPGLDTAATEPAEPRDQPAAGGTDTGRPVQGEGAADSH